MPNLLQFSAIALALLPPLGAGRGLAIAQTPSAAAQEVAGHAPLSGDDWVDRHLLDMDAYARRYPESFADELSRYFDVPRGYVLALLQQPGWEAGDVYMACAVARRKARPCRELVRARAANQDDQGWAGVVTRVPGRDLENGARDLREDIRGSYLRWARPLLEEPDR